MFTNVANGNNISIPGIERPDSNDPNALQYQVLIVEKEGSPSNCELGLKRTIYIGTKGEFTTELGLPEKYINGLPYEGVNMENIFGDLKKDIELSQDILGQYSMVRRLLQARKLSQLIAKSWLQKHDIEDDKPGWSQEEWLKDEEKFYTKKQNIIRFKTIRKLFLTGDQVLDSETNVKFLDYTSQTAEDRWKELERQPYIIMPDQENWHSISLNLLFCGQAYFKYKEENKYLPLCFPMLSTYEACCFYAFLINADSFTGTIDEIQKKGTANPRPPYYKALIPYPPRPDFGTEVKTEKSYNEMIKNWAYAKEIYPNCGDESDKNLLPFCKKAWSPEDGIKLKYITPPYPYLPMSCAS